MANIKISNLNPIDSDIFSNSESYMMDLSDNELDKTHGGAFWGPLGVALTIYGLIRG